MVGVVSGGFLRDTFWLDEMFNRPYSPPASQRVKALSVEAYSQAEAEAAAGVGSYVAPRAVDVPDVAAGLDLDQPPGEMEDDADEGEGDAEEGKKTEQRHGRTRSSTRAYDEEDEDDEDSVKRLLRERRAQSARVKSAEEEEDD